MIVQGAICCIFCRRAFRSVHQATSSRHHCQCGLWSRPTPDGHRYSVIRDLARYPQGIVAEVVATYDTRAEAESRMRSLKRRAA